MHRLRDKNRQQPRKVEPFAPTSYWPAYIQNVFASINQIPLIGLSTACTLIGAALIFFYLRSIGQPVTDFTALLGLAIAATLCAGAIVAGTAFGLFLPAAIVQAYATGGFEESDSPVPFRPWELLWIQVFLVGALLVYFEFISFRDCMESPALWSPLALMVACLTGAVLLEQALLPKTSSARLQRIGFACAFGLTAFMPLILLFALRNVFVGLPVQPIIALLAVCAVVALLNTTVGSRSNRAVVAVMALVVSLIILLWIPLVSGKLARFPTFVASAVGIRSEVARTLGVPKATCLLVQRAAMDAGLVPPNSSCDHDAWNKLTPTVLSNVGANWLLEFGLPLPGKPEAELVSFRVTVPAAGIQSSYQPVETVRASNSKTTVCTSAPVKR